MAKKKTKPEEPELEELDDDEGSDDAAKAADEVKFGASDLAKLANDKFGTNYDARSVRTLLRKMAREDKPRIDREIKQGNRQRYSWSGPDDPEVKMILKAIKAGEIEAGKKEQLDKLKADKAAKTAAKKAEKEAGEGKKKGKGKKAKAAAEVDEDLDEVEDLED